MATSEVVALTQIGLIYKALSVNAVKATKRTRLQMITYSSKQTFMHTYIEKVMSLKCCDNVLRKTISSAI